MEERKISDLVSAALNEEDYEFRINFLLAGLMSADANDTPEKEAKNTHYLNDIYNYCQSYCGKKKEYLMQISKKVKKYLDIPGGNDEY